MQAAVARASPAPATAAASSRQAASAPAATDKTGASVAPQLVAVLSDLAEQVATHGTSASSVLQLPPTGREAALQRQVDVLKARLASSSCAAAGEQEPASANGSKRRRTVEVAASMQAGSTSGGRVALPTAGSRCDLASGSPPILHDHQAIMRQPARHFTMGSMTRQQHSARGACSNSVKPYGPGAAATAPVSQGAAAGAAVLMKLGSDSWGGPPNIAAPDQLRKESAPLTARWAGGNSCMVSKGRPRRGLHSASLPGSSSGLPDSKSVEALAALHIYPFNMRGKPLEGHSGATAGLLQAPKALNLEGRDLGTAGLERLWQDMVRAGW